MPRNLLETTINNPMSEQTYYTLSTYENPPIESGDLMNLGFISLKVSREKDMSDSFHLTISPEHCSYIEFRVLESGL